MAEILELRAILASPRLVASASSAVIKGSSIGRRSRAQMTEPLGKSCPAMHFGKKLGDGEKRQLP